MLLNPKERCKKRRIRILGYMRDGLVYQLRRGIATDRADVEARVDKIDKELLDCIGTDKS